MQRRRHRPAGSSRSTLLASRAAQMRAVPSASERALWSAAGSAAEPDQRAGGKLHRVRADYPHHVWHVDLTVVPTLFGFWVPWLPQALAIATMRREIDAYIGWYLEHRPHESLGGATPAEVLQGGLPAAGRPPLEIRARGRPGNRLRRQVAAPPLLVVTPHEKRAGLPIVEIREAA